MQVVTPLLLIPMEESMEKRSAKRLLSSPTSRSVLLSPIDFGGKFYKSTIVEREVVS